jgi:hypothetical protein
MSAAGHCTGGETYQFHSNGTVDIRSCIDHILRTRQARWQLVGKPPLDVVLLFEGHRYELSFSDSRGAPKMRWRVPSESKIDPQTDIYLALSKD